MIEIHILKKHEFKKLRRNYLTAHGAKCLRVFPTTPQFGINLVHKGMDKVLIVASLLVFPIYL